jgi:hypothetical protein
MFHETSSRADWAALKGKTMSLDVIRRNPTTGIVYAKTMTLPQASTFGDLKNRITFGPHPKLSEALQASASEPLSTLGNWECQVDGGSWRPFDDVIQHRMSDALSRGETRLEGVKIGSFTYSIDLMARTQMNTSTQTERRLRLAMGTWECQVDGGSWKPFDDMIQQQINEAISRGDTRLECVKNGSFTYTIDLMARTQVNTSTQTERKLRISVGGTRGNAGGGGGSCSVM